MSVFKLVFEKEVRRFSAPAPFTFADLKKAFFESFPRLASEAAASSADVRITCMVLHHNDAKEAETNDNSPTADQCLSKSNLSRGESTGVISFAVYDDSSLSMALENFQRTGIAPGKKPKFVARLETDEDSWDLVPTAPDNKSASDENDVEVIEAPNESEDRVAAQPTSDKVGCLLPVRDDCRLLSLSSTAGCCYVSKPSS